MANKTTKIATYFALASLAYSPLLAQEDSVRLASLTIPKVESIRDVSWIDHYSSQATNQNYSVKESSFNPATTKLELSLPYSDVNIITRKRKKGLNIPDFNTDPVMKVYGTIRSIDTELEDLVNSLNESGHFRFKGNFVIKGEISFPKASEYFFGFTPSVSYRIPKRVGIEFKKKF